MNVQLLQSGPPTANASLFNMHVDGKSNRKRTIYLMFYALLLVSCVLLVARQALEYVKSAETGGSPQNSDAAGRAPAASVLSSKYPEAGENRFASASRREDGFIISQTAASGVESSPAAKISELVPVPETQRQSSGRLDSTSRLESRVNTSPVRHPGPFHDQMVTPANFTYLGAFRPPRVESLRSDFSFGGSAITFHPKGDPGGETDGFPGSLFVVGNPAQELVAEISIPRPVISQDHRLEDLPQATVLQPFADLTGGVRNQMTQGSSEPFRIGGLHIVDDRIHWTLYKYYNVETIDYPSHATSSLSLATPDVRGLWHLGPSNTGRSEWHSYKHAGYIFDIPESFANAWFGGRNLISGLQIATGLNIASHGPAMYAYRLPSGDTQSEVSLEATPLIYNDINQPAPDFHPADRWTGAAWLSVEGRETVIVAGRKALGPVYYGEARPIDCTVDKGYHGTPYEAQIRFFAPQALIAAAHGKIAPTAMTPWYVWNDQTTGGGFSQYLFPACSQHLGGVSYDRVNNLIYIVQTDVGATADHPYEIMPLVHVFRLNQGFKSQPR